MKQGIMLIALWAISCSGQPSYEELQSENEDLHETISNQEDYIYDLEGKIDDLEDEQDILRHKVDELEDIIERAKDAIFWDGDMDWALGILNEY